MMPLVASICACSEATIDRGDNDIGGERQVRRLELEALVLRQRFLAFDLAPHAAEYVGRIGDVERRCGDAVRDSTEPVWPCDAGADTCCCWPEALALKVGNRLPCWAK